MAPTFLIAPLENARVVTGDCGLTTLIGFMPLVPGHPGTTSLVILGSVPAVVA